MCVGWRVKSGKCKRQTTTAQQWTDRLYYALFNHLWNINLHWRSNNCLNRTMFRFYCILHNCLRFKALNFHLPIKTKKMLRTTFSTFCSSDNTSFRIDEKFIIDGCLIDSAFSMIRLAELLELSMSARRWAGGFSLTGLK